MEKYTIQDEPDAKGEVTVQRKSDGKLVRCRRTWFKPFAGAEGGLYVAKSRVKAIRLDGLDWAEEL